MNRQKDPFCKLILFSVIPEGPVYGKDMTLFELNKQKYFDKMEEIKTAFDKIEKELS